MGAQLRRLGESSVRGDAWDAEVSTLIADASLTWLEKQGL